ncbi:hypothetical protein BEN78_10750 [Xanthomonas citri pv. mangiferaeindicae]|nr:hypothetical protein BEN78_10750 [Xanthomonas citri pv. mangiferaeindicae]
MHHFVPRCVLAVSLLAAAVSAAHAQSALDRLKGLGGGRAQTALDVGSDVVKGLTLSDADIATLGAEAAVAYDAENLVAPASDPYAQRLARLVAGWENDAGLNLNFKVYRTPEINAFALPDGSVRVFSGLMDAMDDDELRFVIGHEIGHVKHGHSKARFRTAYLAQAARKGVASTNNAAGRLAASELGGVVEEVVKAQHSQSNELESDGYGLGLLQRGGFNPQAAVTALQKLDDGGPKAGMLSSHPDPARRAQRIQAQLR